MIELINVVMEVMSFIFVIVGVCSLDCIVMSLDIFMEEVMTIILIGLMMEVEKNILGKAS